MEKIIIWQEKSSGEATKLEGLAIYNSKWKDVHYDHLNSFRWWIMLVILSAEEILVGVLPMCLG